MSLLIRRVLIVLALGGAFLLLLQRPSERAPSQGIAAVPSAEEMAPTNTPATAAAAEVARVPVATAQASPVFARFEEWTREYVAASPAERPALVREGARLAALRRPALAELIVADPRRALESAVPMTVRQTLPPEIVAHLEERVSARAFFGVLGVLPADKAEAPIRREVVLAEGKRYDAYTFGRRLAQQTTQDASVSGIAVDRALALDSRPLRVLEAGEIPDASKPIAETCPVSGKSTAVARKDGALPPIARDTPAVEIAGTIHYLCEGGHIHAVEEALVAAEGASGGPVKPTGTTSTWTVGPRTLLYMRVAFPETRRDPQTETAAYDMMRQVNDFFVENSYGTVYLLTTVAPLIILPHSEAWYNGGGGDEFDLRPDAQQAAREMGYDTSSYDLDIVVYTGGPGTFGGLGYVGGKGVWLRSISVGVACHELGHNFGLWHANFWNTGGASVIGNGSNTEYGNIFDTMGSASAGDYHFNSNHKSQLNWLPKQSFVSPVTTSGAFRIFAHDQPRLDPANRYALRVTKDSGREYWVEFRQKSFAGNRWIKDGVLLMWDPWAGSSSGAQLLDTSPGSPDDRTDAALTIGRTFSDLESGIHITPIGKGGTVPESMDVVVNVGAFPSNQAPGVAVSASAAAAALNASVTFTAAANDPDNDSLSYSWDFGDKTFSTTNSPVAVKAWSAAGDYVVRCVVSDMKGGTASDDVLVTVGSPTTFRVSGRVTLGGQPLANVRVHNGQTTTNYRGAFTDSAGNYIISGLTGGSYTLGAALYGYSFSAAGFANPVTVGPSVVNADFTASTTATLTLTASVPATTEGSVTPGAFTLTRTGSTASALTVNFQAPSGSAIKGPDYALAPDLTSASPYSTVSIPAGQASLDLVLTATDDATAEGPETATLDLAPAGYIIAGSGTASVLIQDNDSTLPVVTLKVTGPDALENGSSAEFAVFRTGATASALTVAFAVSGTATSGADYASIGTQVVIPAGAASAPIVISPLNDALAEGTETVTVTLSTNAAYIRAPSSADYAGTVNILDDDIATLTVTAADATATEAGADPGTFLITRSGSTSLPLTVNYALGGSAHHGVDYTPVSGVLTIAAGSSVGTVTIRPIADALGEPQQTAILQLRGSAAYIVGNPGIATINLTDSGDVPVVTVDVTDGVVGEPGDTGTFRFTTTGTGAGNIAVRYMVSGTATAGVDYTIAGLDTATLIGTVSMARNATSNLLVTPLNDALVEGYESITVTILPDAAYSSFLDAAATMNLADDDAAIVSVSTANDAFAEGSGTGKFWISRGAAGLAALDVNYTMSGTATNGDDYTFLPGVVTIPAVASGVAVSFTAVDDAIAEGTETIVMNIAPGSYGIGVGSATHYLADNDASPVLVKFSSGSGSGAENIGAVSIPVVLTAASADPVTVEYFIGGGNATAGVDYAFAPGTLTFAPGETAKTLTLTILDDAFQEPAETVQIKLRNANGASLGTSTYTFTIADNDAAPAPVVGFASTAASGAESVSPAPIVVSLSAPQPTAVTVDFAVTGGTATNGTDYSIANGTLTFAPGETAKIVPNSIADDAVAESNETIVLALSNPTGAALSANATHTFTILDNDAATVSVSAPVATAREANQVPGQFTLTRTGSTAAALTVNVSIGGTATNGADYQSLANTVVIAAGQASASVPVAPIDDGLIEASETVILTIAPGTGYTVGGAASASVTLLDGHEPSVTLAATDPNAMEWGHKPAVFTLSRTGPTDAALSVTITMSGAATEGLDYADVPAQITIPVGASSAAFNVTPFIDSLVEGSETVVATVSPAPGYVPGSPAAATAAIADAPADSWRAAKFGASANNPAIGDDLADPDFDGLTNLLEYALASDPNDPAAAKAPIIGRQGTDVTLIFRRALAATDVVFSVEELRPDGSWQPVSFTQAILADDGTVRTIKANVAAAGAAKKIVHLKVTRP